MKWIGLALVGCLACGGSDAGDGVTDGGSVEGTLLLAPATTDLVVVNGAPATAVFTATLRAPDGTEHDVTSETAFSISNSLLGSFAGAQLTAYGAAGGTGFVMGSYRGSSGVANVNVYVSNVRVDDTAPPDAPDLFDAAADDPALAPTIAYPTTGTIMPPNIGDFEVHWRDVAGANLFEVVLASEFVTMRVYTAGPPNAGAYVSLLPSEWKPLGDSLRGDSLNATVRGMVAASPATAGTSAPVEVLLTDQDVEGGIYYWASTSQTGAAGIFRHDMSRPGQSAEPFYTTDQSPDARCVACHALSRNGERMAITFDGGNGAATVLDVATRTPTLAVDGAFAWNFASFDPTGERLFTVSNGVISLRQSDTGAALGTVPSAGYATHPDVSPDGTAITYVQVGTPNVDWSFTGGQMVVQSYDPATLSFGDPVPVVGGPENIYYPSWSPDGEWLLFNKSTEDAYDNTTAELWIARVDGSIAPIRIDSPNVTNSLTNSWARWAPFEQTLDLGGEMPEPFFWLTFSSKREFGVRLAAGRPQVWMAPFFPLRAISGQDPSSPAFRLPFQDIASNNHIAQWTETIVPIE